MLSELKTCDICNRENLPESSFCDLCGSPFEVLVECGCDCCHPEPVFVEPDYPEAVFPDPGERPEVVFATIISR
jgi:hypothetical protein